MNTTTNARAERRKLGSRKTRKGNRTARTKLAKRAALKLAAAKRGAK